MKKRASLMTALVLLLSTIQVLVNHGSSDAQESQMVRILGASATGASELRKQLRLEPPGLTVSKGAVVIWLNWARTAQCVKVVFDDGKKCEDVTDAPTGFEAEGPCYVTSWIPFGGTSSLRFNEPGTFTYVVEAKAGGESHKESGRIFVK